MTKQETLSNTKETVEKGARILSVDALRGFDMFWIVGADSLCRALGEASDSGPAQFAARQLEHVPWEGFVFYDLIFPLFVFIIGMSIVFSLDKHVQQEGHAAAYKRIVRRFILLFLLGAFYDKGISDLARESPFSGVLQRLSWCYLFTSLLYTRVKLRGLISVCLAILIGYWALLTFVKAPGQPEVSFEKDKTIVNWVDYKFLPLKEEGQYSDPEGLLSTIPAVASCILGVLAGLTLRNPKIDGKKKVLYFLAAGVLLVAAGYLWGLQLPVIKRLWTSSYVLVAGGYSCLLVGIFYWIVDVLQYRKWALPFIWIGANPLTTYLGSEFIDFESMGKRVVGGPIAGLFGQYGELLTTTASIVFVFLFVRFLYNRKIFLRV
ncbi:MAG: DUF5009 domain-containing protein [Candidatus Hydrogenedentes bacterium]|nr:DUF5009 domain-containing protein [Candidatus Hydrogenedentota bacterium]